MDRENGGIASTSKNIFSDPLVDLKTCQLLSQGAEAVRPINRDDSCMIQMKDLSSLCAFDPA